jgi:ribosomal protein S18 acetylase RimI-like enzyme
MLGRTTIVAGDPAALGAALSLHPGPRRSYLSTGAPEHLTILHSAYTVTAPLTMMRMTVTAPDFAPAGADARLLRGLDVRALNGLYATGGGPTGYRAGHIDQGVYYGTFENRRLVAAAGTHLVAPHAGVAVVGNVYTHPSYRGQGLATQVTSAVTAHLFDRGCPLVTLTVAPENAPALHAYGQLGYCRGATIVEAKLKRRSVFGLRPLARRWLARRNSGVARTEAAPPES